MKKKSWTIVVLLLFVVVVFPASELQAQAGKGKYLIMIDPAHGGEDTGVNLTDKYHEKDLVLAIAQAVRKEFAQSGKYEIKLTRSVDRLISITDRIKIVKAAQPDLFISFHVNAGFGKNASGYELYFPGFAEASSGNGGSSAIIKDMTRNKYLNDSVKWAQIIQRNLQKVFPRKGRGLREADTLILKDLTIPSVVLEIAFATNPHDHEKLMEGKTRQAVTEAISRSIKEYF
ncbi:MAG: N-acetylmuramoyl-L-alanine amidase [Deltaproteobacteria bacterium]|nr:N-acetylmuramoyl-L-alanine amidase [Deltaproteobacteria bacterium]